MRIDSVRDAVRKSPFEPFIMRLADGRTLSVQHPELISIGRSVLYLLNLKEQTYRMVDPLLVVSIEWENAGNMTLPPPYRRPTEDDDYGSSTIEE